MSVPGNFVGTLLYFGIPSSGDHRLNGNFLGAGATETSGNGGGVGVARIRNANTATASNPTSCGVMYV